MSVLSVTCEEGLSSSNCIISYECRKKTAVQIKIDTTFKFSDHPYKLYFVQACAIKVYKRLC